MSWTRKIILGTANFKKNYGIFNNKLSENKINSFLNHAKKRKVRFLDTARDYQIKEHKLFKDFQLYKKINLEDNLFNDENLDTKLNIYLFNSKLPKKCYGVTIRKPYKLLNPQGREVMKYLLRLKNNRKINKIGISIYDTKNLNNIIGKFKIDYIQLSYNILNLNIFKETKKIIKNKNIEIHFRSIFLQGLLLKNKEQLPKELKKLKKYWKKIEKVINTSGLSKIAFCLNHALSANPDKIILGANSIKQLDEILDINFKHIKLEDFKIKEKYLIDPIYWLKFITK